MYRRFNPHPNKVTKGVAEVGTTAILALDYYGRLKAMRGEWTFAYPFFIVANAIAFYCGLKDAAIGIGILFSILGACLATYLNRRQRKRVRLGLAKPYVPPAPSPPKPLPRYQFGGPFCVVGFLIPILLDKQDVSGGFFFAIIGLIVGYCLSLLMNWRDRKIKKRKTVFSKNHSEEN